MRIVAHIAEHDKPMASICHGIEILAAADAIRGRQDTTIVQCRCDAEFSGGEYLEQPVVISGNVVCCQKKKDIAPWMKPFTSVLYSYITHPARATTS